MRKYTVLVFIFLAYFTLYKPITLNIKPSRIHRRIAAKCCAVVSFNYH